MKVRIIKDSRYCWYHGLAGEIFTVIEFKEGYVVSGGDRDRLCISKEDAEVVEDVEKSCETCGLSLGNRKKDIFCEEVVGTCKDNDKWQPVEQVEEKSCANCKYDYLLSDEHPCNKCSPSRDMWKPIGQVEDVVAGVGQGAPTVTNEQGGKQSRIATAFSLVPHDSLLAVAKVMKIGSERYDKDNWRKLSADEIYDHLMEHLVNWHFTGSMEELEHGITRAMMLYSVVNHGK